LFDPTVICKPNCLNTKYIKRRDQLEKYGENEKRKERKGKEKEVKEEKKEKEKKRKKRKRIRKRKIKKYLSTDSAMATIVSFF
jgi:hypothetical protein